MSVLEPVLDRGLPEPLLRFGIRRLLKQRLKEEDGGSAESREARLAQFISEMDASPIALQTQSANAQHYEVPPRFFELVLGPRLKYSACWWGPETRLLAEAEENMLRTTAERARIAEGQDILELGCGWGSLTLFLAERFPRSRITAVSNSRPQKEFILNRARQRGLSNVQILTRDMNVFQADRKYDRVVSVEMFEHMRNYRKLLQRVAGFLKPEGRLFLHIFVHREYAYPFVSRGAGDWMARHFFSGGMMPSADLLLRFPEHLRVRERWKVSGIHYQKTAEAWLRNHETHRTEIVKLFNAAYGAREGFRWWNRWKIFFLSCSELWGYRNGGEWFIGHYLMEPGRES